jgi:sugar phosphate isomerase/epimerase
VRVFSFWRTVAPERNLERITEILAEGGEVASRSGVRLGLENEPACHFATGEEVAGAIDTLDSACYGVVWDPGNAFVAGETAVPDGYRKVPAERICHVHVKDCTRNPSSGQPEWCDIGAGDVRWKEQLAALATDGYKGAVSLETHWTGPGGDKYLGTTICAKSLARLLAQS